MSTVVVVLASRNGVAFDSKPNLEVTMLYYGTCQSVRSGEWLHNTQSKDKKDWVSYRLHQLPCSGVFLQDYSMARKID